MRSQLKGEKGIKEKKKESKKVLEEIFKAELYFWSHCSIPRFVTDFKEILPANIAEEYFINIYICLIPCLFLPPSTQTELYISLIINNFFLFYKIYLKHIWERNTMEQVDEIITNPIIVHYTQMSGVKLTGWLYLLANHTEIRRENWQKSSRLLVWIFLRSAEGLAVF